MGFLGGVASSAGPTTMPPQYTKYAALGSNVSPLGMGDSSQSLSGASGKVAMGGGGAQTPGQGLFNVQTSITPQPVYNQNQTQYAKNQAMADAYQQSSFPWLLKQFDRPGMSRSQGTIGAATPQYVQGLANAGMAQQAIPFQDAAANAQNMLQGETARESEAQGLARVLAGFQGSNQNAQIAQQNQLLSLLSQLLG